MRVKTAFVFSICLSIVSFSSAQRMVTPAPAPVVATRPAVSEKDLVKVKLLEDTLHQLSNRFTDDTLIEKRREACYEFIPKFVRALKYDNSFYFPFDSFETIAKIYSPDSLFRIFTWQLAMPKGRFRYFGVIQMKSTRMKIYPLFDLSDTMEYHPQITTTHENWYGALYYNIISKQADKKTIYTLFGYEAADVITRRKVIEILTFDEKGVPHFGAPLFHFKYEDSLAIKPLDTLHRFFIEYKYNASTILNYDKELEMIVFDHVAPPSQKAHGATFSYVPDGTYEGFKWGNNRWNWIEKVFTFAINEDDNPPIPVPLFGQPKRQPELPGGISPK